ncbi:SUKH-4 family immunity protein [Streptomyces decoyicus]
MPIQDQAPEPISAAEGAAAIVAWWQEGQPHGEWLNVVDQAGHDGATALREVHGRVDGSILVDATGRTTEELEEEILRALGVDLSPGKRSAWRTALRRLNEGCLVLVVNAHRAGTTRLSFEPERFFAHAVGSLSRGRAGLVVHGSPRRRVPKAPVVVRLEGDEQAGKDWPVAVRALALSEPRVVPMRMWAELAAALSGEPVAELALTRVLEEFSAELASDEHGVRFTDENLAGDLRRDTAEQDVKRVNRRMADRLLRMSAEFRHPEGWSASGPDGAYAATGLAMHAAQAGYLQDLPEDHEGPWDVFGVVQEDAGSVANIPQSVLLDAASCAHAGALPGNSAAADASYLWLYGITPAAQTEWAAWLHLMAMARGDHPFAAAIADSGVRLPWKVKWTQWRPPGAYHHRFLSCSGCDGLTEVRWQGLPAIAGLDSNSSEGTTTIWDPTTGHLLAGPWHGEEIPEEHHADLTWPPGTEGDGPGPTTFDELFEAMPDQPDVHPLLLAAPALPMGDVTILAGNGGLFAVEPAEGGDFTGTSAPRFRPLSGPYVAANETTPVDAPPPSPADLIALYGADEIRKFRANQLPSELTDEATRRTLTEFGLPAMQESGMGIYPWGSIGRLPEIFEEISWPSDIELPQESGPFFQIGFWMGGDLVIDGPSGHVLRVPTEQEEEHLEGLPAACGLENFLTLVALWITGLRLASVIDDTDEVFLLRQHVQAAQGEVDEVGAEAAAWSYIFHNE